MLERFFQRIYKAALVFVVILIAGVMALTFGGPQAEGCSSGGAVIAATVYGEQITEGEFKAAYALAGFDQQPDEVAETNRLKEIILEGITERVLLAREARELGFDVTEDEVMEQLVEDATVYLSTGVSAPDNMPSGLLPVPVRDQDGAFDLENAKNFIKYRLRRTATEFAMMQVEEQLAHRMRQLVMSTVVVSPREVWEAYVRERETARVSYIRFRPRYYQDTINPTQDDLRAWVEANAETIDREYQANRHRYTGLDRQVRARHILIEVGAEASDDVKEAARARATALLARARAGEDFATLARANSDDTGSARRGGDLGYNPEGRMVSEFDEAQFALQPGEISDLVETQFGFHIIKVEGIREGDVPEDEAKLELADRLYREERAAELAREAAETALASLRGGTSLEDVAAVAQGRTPPSAAEGEQATEGEDGEDGEDSLPEEEDEDPLAPRVEETRAFGRGDAPISGADNGALVSAAFDLNEDNPFPETVMPLGNDFLVFRIDERTHATEEDFTDEVKLRLTSGLTESKRRDALRIYVARLRAEAEAADEIYVNPAMLRYGEEEQPADDDGDDEDDDEDDD